ncbi:MAG: BREX-3 system phosphatase PglZ [Anaerolineae bacterium]|nr:BREX-3 system phosphatase PglZ [Anaerolineae bacterium]
MSTTWQQAILAHFQPKRERMLLVIDPDNLLRDDALLAEIQNSNYDILELDDEVTFRNKFERTYRSRWDEGEAHHLVVVVHTINGARHIPYDLRQKSKYIELGVADLFPQLNAITVRQLDNVYYTDLYPAHQQLVARNELLRTERRTIEFILRVVFDLEPTVANQPVRWVKFLIDKHYRARELPPAMEEYLVQNLLPNVTHAGLRPEFLTDGAVFFEWLGQQWATYVAQILSTSPHSSSPSAPTIDFADSRLRPLLSSLFSEGLVSRAPAPTPAVKLSPNQEWLAAGLTTIKTANLVPGTPRVAETGAQVVYNLKARLARFQALDATNRPVPTSDVRDWLNLAAEWAELVYQANYLLLSDYQKVQPELFTARQNLDNHFWDFIQARYSAVSYYEDNKGPISLMAVNKWLRQQVSDKTRLVLLCFDGLALDQWLLLRDYLQKQLSGLSVYENRAYALAPTLTPISRQALFAGRPPTAFAESINKTDRDGDHWRAYWINNDIPEPRVAYARVKVNGQGLDEIKVIAESKNRRLGVLLNLFDDVMHSVAGMTPEADKRVYYDILSSHLQNGRLAELFDLLLQQGYRVFVTADHGNIAGVGNGLKLPKALIDSYARRVAIFDKESLAEEYAQTHNLRRLPLKILPPDLHPVYLPGNQLFDMAGVTKISHGGLSLEELIVPFVEVIRS